MRRAEGAPERVLETLFCFFLAEFFARIFGSQIRSDNRRRAFGSIPHWPPRKNVARTLAARRFVSIVFLPGSARGAKIDLALGKRRQLLVGCLFLIERLLQDGGRVVAAELLCPRDQAAVTRDLVVLGGLC